MPIYEYVCNDCGKKFELIENFHNDKEKDCEYCSGKARRVVSQSSFVLKGTGWYLTDYAKKSSHQDSDQKKGAPQESKGKEEKPGSGDSSEKESTSVDTPKPTAKKNEK